MGFEKIEAKSLTDLFVQKIEGMILSGELTVGDQLPPVRELCTLMGVSRPVVTAGLIELEKMGFVEVRSRQGVYITDYRRKGTLETFNVLMRYNGGIMRDEEVRSVIEMRLANEVLCVRLVIERAAPEELDSLAPMSDAIRTAASNEAAAEATYELLHEECVLSGNVFLPLFLNSMRSHCLYFCTLYCKRYGIGSLYQNRLKLYQAMLNRDVKSAIEIARGVLDDAVSGEHQLYGKP